MLRSMLLRHKLAQQLLYKDALITNAIPIPWKLCPSTLQLTCLRNFSSDNSSDNHQETANAQHVTPSSKSPEQETNKPTVDKLKNAKIWQQWVEGRVDDNTALAGTLPSNHGGPATSPNLRPKNPAKDWKHTSRSQRSTQDRIASILSSEPIDTPHRPAGKYSVLGTASDAPRHIPGAAARAEEISPQRIAPHRLFYPGATYSPEDLNPYKAKEVVIKSDLMVHRGTIPARQVKESADFRNSTFLSNFITDGGKLFPRRRTRLPSKVHRELARQIKLARALGIMNPTQKIVLHHGKGGGGGMQKQQRQPRSGDNNSNNRQQQQQ